MKEILWASVLNHPKLRQWIDQAEKSLPGLAKNQESDPSFSVLERDLLAVREARAGDFSDVEAAIRIDEDLRRLDDTK